jgi:hypothetical protein
MRRCDVYALEDFHLKSVRSADGADFSDESSIACANYCWSSGIGDVNSITFARGLPESIEERTHREHIHHSS